MIAHTYIHLHQNPWWLNTEHYMLAPLVAQFWATAVLVRMESNKYNGAMTGAAQKTGKLHRKSSRMRTSTSRCDHLLWIAGDSQHHLGFRRISPEFSEVDSMCTWKYNPPHTFAVQTTLCYPGANIDVENHNFNRYFIQEWVIFHSSVRFPYRFVG